MGIFVPFWVVIVIIILFIYFSCGPRTRETMETLLSPFGVAPRQADLTEIAFRSNMYAGR